MEPENNLNLPVNDIIAPDAIAHWPPAIGWWLLLALVILLFVVGIKYIRRYQQHWRYRKAALSELKAIMELSNSNTISPVATELMTIIKRVSLTAYPQNTFATLNASRFLQTINRTFPQAVFCEETINNIDDVLYSEQREFNINTFYHECCHWVKHHPEQHNENNGAMSDV